MADALTEIAKTRFGQSVATVRVHLDPNVLPIARSIAHLLARVGVRRVARRAGSTILTERIGVESKAFALHLD
ncbi:hypothetical protein CLV84_2925 [Neolewinella xylanilytica]|uniref:Uncharacterized protein n=1 Tax=Neolewinella xylanilytica TaxID=1514080 RepID=A0A2S6I4A6_9BACT|nr:hypothetical protein CLV84_2925 [Neolewinella xylanilytica]